MILIRPSFKIEHVYADGLKLIETAGRTCYKSESLITSASAMAFAKMIMKRGHESVIEHSSMTVRFVCDRGVSHELVRHRLCAFSQESTRYCNYKGGVCFVIPPWVGVGTGVYKHERFGGGWWKDGESNFQFFDMTDRLWAESLAVAEDTYIELMEKKWTPQEARSVLPNSLKTEIVVTANFREWRHIFKLRTTPAAHPQMREIMSPLLLEVKDWVPVIFEDINPQGAC